MVITVDVIQAPIVTKVGTNSGTVTSEVSYNVTAGDPNIGKQVEYVLTVLDTNTGEFLAEKKRFITIDPNDQFPSRTMSTSWVNFSGHPDILVQVVLAIGTTNITQAEIFTFNLGVTPTGNVQYTYTFPDGHTITNVVTEFEFSILETAPKHTAILTSIPTTSNPTTNAVNTLTLIQAHKEGDVAPPPTSNQLFTYTFPDGHTITGVVTGFEFSILNDAPRHTATLTSTNTTQTPTTTAINTIQDITAHESSDEVIPPPPDDNRIIIYTFPDGHIESGIVTAFESTILDEAPRHTATLSINLTTTNPNTTAVQMIALITAHEQSDISPPVLPNTLFNLHFTDDSILDFVLTNEDFAIWTTPAPFNQPIGFPSVVLQNATLTNANPITIAQLDSLVLAHLATLPVNPDSDSYDLVLTIASYLPTALGKTVNIQAVANLKGTPTTEAVALLTIKQGLTQITIHNETKNLTVTNGIIEPIIFNIDDIGATGEATATLTAEVFLFNTVDGFPLSRNSLIIPLVFESEPVTPKSASILTKFMGATALLGTLALLGSKRR